MHYPATDPAAAVQPTAAAGAAHLHGLCGVLTWMQHDTLPLVAYAYVSMIHDSLHAGLLMHSCMHACLSPCPCLRVVSINSMTRLFRGSIPVLYVLQHLAGLLHPHFSFSMH
jgi:hypothetical protein